MDPTVSHLTAADGDAAAYDRALLCQYLEHADAERTRLETALAAARQRRRTAEAALRFDLQTRDELANDLDDLTRHLDEERQTTWHQVQAILAEGELEAVAIVAAARAFAAEILAGRDSIRPALGLLPGGSGDRRLHAVASPDVGRLVG